MDKIVDQLRDTDDDIAEKRFFEMEDTSGSLSIHKEESINFYKTVLKASPWTIAVLSHGYVIPFDRIPGYCLSSIHIYKYLVIFYTG